MVCVYMSGLAAYIIIHLLCMCALMPKIYWTHFHVSSPQTEKLPTCCGLVGKMATSCFLTSHRNGIWQRTRHIRHNGLLPVPTCCSLVRTGPVARVGPTGAGPRQKLLGPRQKISPIMFKIKSNTFLRYRFTLQATPYITNWTQVEFIMTFLFR